MRPAAQVGVGGQRRRPAASCLAGVEVGEAAGARASSAGQVVAVDVGDLRGEAEPAASSRTAAAQPGRVQPAGVGHDLDAALQAGAEDLLQLREERRRVAAGGPLQPALPARISMVSSAS